MIISELMKSCFDEGQNRFIELIKQSLYRQDNNIFDKIDFQNDQIYLEPLLFNYFTQKENKRIPLKQILYKHLNEDFKKEVQIYTNEFGEAYIPDQGYVKTEHADKLLTIRKGGIFNGDNKVAYTEVPCDYIGDTGIELCSYKIPEIDRFYKEWDERGDEVEEVTIEQALYQKCKDLIEQTFNLIKEHAEDYYTYCLKATKKIVLFKSSYMPGFVTREAHGVSYLSVKDDANIAYFIEEIVHQCGHNIFNAITCDSKEFMQVHPSTSLQKIAGHNRVYDMNIDGAYHGIFTVCTGVQVLYKLFGNVTNLDKRDEHDLRGRLGIKGTRFRTWTNEFDLSKVFTEKGLKLYNELDQPAFNIIESNPKYFGSLDFSNQPSIFSYEKFLELNEL